MRAAAPAPFMHSDPVHVRDYGEQALKGTPPKPAS